MREYSLPTTGLKKMCRRRDYNRRGFVNGRAYKCDNLPFTVRCIFDIMSKETMNYKYRMGKMSVYAKEYEGNDTTNYA